MALSRDRTYQTHAGVTAAQMPAYFIGKLVPGLGRVPTWRPGKGHLLPRLVITAVSFHGIGKRGIRVLRHPWLADVLVRPHGSTAAVSVGLPRQLQAINAVV